MKIYAGHGVNEFVVTLGYKGDVIRRYFSDLLRRPDPSTRNWSIELVDTGDETMTGGRLLRIADRLTDGTFMMTYGDGVADVDIGQLAAFHTRHGRAATVCAVRPPARFGALSLDGDRVERFSEKSQADEGWINGGFFVLEPKVLDYIDDDETIWEREPLERLAAEGQLMAYRHHSFWQPMDTMRDKRALEALWESGEAPWQTWS
jgi:glucose-1-phosphate cytidylyltransferase